jgi:signal transduction histidine kinase/FixJ family two-component response regulator
MMLGERVLVRAPTGRDAQLTRSLLRESGLSAHLCEGLDEMASELERGAGAILLTEDVESSGSLAHLLGAIARQPQWSEVPVLVLAHPVRAQPSMHRLATVPGLTLLERPVHSRTLVSALQSALRARRRQYQLKAQLEAMHDLQARLAEELSGMHRLHVVGARLLQAAALEPLLTEVLDVAIDLTGATHGTLEIARGTDALLAMVAQSGFDVAGPFAPRQGRTATAPPPVSATGAAFTVPSLGPAMLAVRNTLRGSLDEIERSGSVRLGAATLRRLRTAGIRSLQCAPLLGAAGRPLGVLSVYWSVAARESETRRVLFDLLARQASELIERDQAEQERRAADRRKDEFLATLAHELRNPLAPIRQAARVARAPLATPEQQRWSTEIIERQVSHMALLLDDLLDVSRITRGTLVLRRERVQLADVVEAAVETSRPAIEARAHALRVEMPDTPVWLDVDPLRLAQVLANLLNNAAKYTDRGGQIALWSRIDGERLSLHVRDNGIGLDAAALSRVFEMFSQVTASIERSEGGLGIGLALVRGLVEMHGGRVEARSEGPGCGSEFIVSLALPDAARGAPTAAASILHAAVPAERRILVADDNVDAAESLAVLLRLEGHVVEVVHDGEAALGAARGFRPDVVLLDIGMPKLNGYEAARRLRTAAAGGPLALIAVTGWGQSEDRHQAALAGFDHHLTKPVDFERLLELVAATGVVDSGVVLVDGRRA